MIPSPQKLPPNNQERLEALNSYNVLDTPCEKEFDELTLLASTICESPISIISFIDKDRIWFKAKTGVTIESVSLKSAFCLEAIMNPEPLVVTDTTKDSRFVDNPLVTGIAGIRFYAGVAMIDSAGFPLGTICVLDKEPRTLSEKQIMALGVLSQQVIKLLELRRVNKDLENANNIQKQMLSVLSHDLRSPLNTFQSFLELTSRNEVSKEQFDALIPELKNSINGTLFMVGNLLEWGASRLHAKALEKQPFSLRNALNQIIKENKISFEVKENEVVNNVTTDIQLLANKTLTETILRNLILNANKFTEKGKIILSARQEEDFVSIEVSDTGKGIPSDRISKLFSWERRVSTPGTKGERGSGLGLAICKQFIEAHGGKISLSTELGKGTAFTFSLPSAPTIKSTETKADPQLK